MSNELNPVVGDEAYVQHYSDRHPVTVIDVLSPCKVIVQYASYERIDKKNMSDVQEYKFSANPYGPKAVFTKRRNGCWVKKGSNQNDGPKLGKGYKAYYDFSF